MSTTLDAVVVGAGTNGLTAAAILARRGLRVQVLEAGATPGGGCRSAELTLAGYMHDHCAAIHALGAISPAFQELRLHEHGVRWLKPPVALAHPLDGGRVGVLQQDLDASAADLGLDGDRYRRLVGPLVRHWPELSGDILGPMVKVPSHPIKLAAFGIGALPPASWIILHWLRTPEAKALWAGSAAHAVLPLNRPLTNSFGLLLNSAVHLGGWPVAEGGSGRIVDALVAVLRHAGGEVACNQRIDRLGQLPPSRLVLFDLAASQVLRLAGDAMPAPVRRAFSRFRHGPGVFKVDYALDGPIPWTNEHCRRAGTVHVGGDAAEIMAAEAEVAAGRHPERPFVLVAQQDVADPGRVPPGKAALWAYCHVPAGSTLDRSAAIEAQIERFAPGFKDLILARHHTNSVQMEAYNPSFVGGDISGGSHGGLQLLARPRLSPRPYHLGWNGAFLCSASAAPGGGVHGMAGYHAAHAALDSIGA
ncbi:MAG: phytoene desaturase family protein [Acidimicrobiales bacterium]